jgi:hypothetical protein
MFHLQEVFTNKYVSLTKRVSLINMLHLQKVFTNKYVSLTKSVY